MSVKCGRREGAILWNSRWVWGKPWRRRRGGFEVGDLAALVRTKRRAPRVVVMYWEEKLGKWSVGILYIIY